MIVPVAVNAARIGARQRDGQQIDAGFDQPSRQQTLLSPAGAPIAVAQPIRFTVQIERPPGGVAGQHVESLLMEGVHGLGGRGANLTVQTAEQRASLAQTRPISLRARTCARIRLTGIVVNAKGRVRAAQVGRSQPGHRSGHGLGRRQTDIIGNGPAPLPAQVIGYGQAVRVLGIIGKTLGTVPGQQFLHPLRMAHGVLGQGPQKTKLVRNGRMAGQ